MDIPTAPIIDESKQTRILGADIMSLPCHVLSKAACSKRPTCKYNEDGQVCEPTDSIAYSLRWFQSRKAWRNNIKSWLSDASCSLYSYMQNVSVFTAKESASSSIIISGLINPTAMDKEHAKNSNVILKITFDPLSPVDNSLYVEIAIYRNIITQLVMNNNTPHVVNYLGFTRCFENELVIHKTNKLQEFRYKKQLKNIDPKLYSDTTNILFCERSSGTTFADWTKSKTNRTLPELLSIIFQIMYTLVCFARIGLQHNDLHQQNIFIEEFNTPITLYYQRGPDEYIELKTKHMAKIYDWDRGSILHPAIPSNLELTKFYCQTYGTCETYNPKFDMFEFLALFIKYSMANVSDPVASELDTWLNKVIDLKWYISIVNREHMHSLKYLESPTDDQLKSPREAFRLFCDNKWSESPFIIHKGNGEFIPKEIFFKPPTERIRKYKLLTPVSSFTHEDVDLSELPPTVNPMDVNIFPNLIILHVWRDELIKDKHDVRVNKLANKIHAKHAITEPYKVWFSVACGWLGMYRFHSLNDSQQRALLGHPFMIKIVDFIWNMFNNTLPIQIPSYVFE